MEHKLLHGIVRVSQRRTPKIQLLEGSDFEVADIVMIDTHDPSATASPKLTTPKTR